MRATMEKATDSKEGVKDSYMREMSSEELEEYYKFKEAGNKHLESEEEIDINPWTDEFAKMIQLFRIITEKMRFNRPFRITIDYDPKQPRAIIKHYTSKESDEQ